MMKRSSLTSSVELKKKNKLICGIDEAGRGPVLGPMIISGACINYDQLESLSQLGVKDSKKLSPAKRTSLSKKINQICDCKSFIVTPEEIDRRIDLKISLSRLEQLKMAEIINFFKPDVIYIDAADVNEKRFGYSMRDLLIYTPPKLISKHKADERYPIVSAASIIAKVTRDRLIAELHGKFGDFGSGYTSDEKTINYLTEWIQKHKKAPDFARKSWNTVKRILESEVLTRKITDFI
jgi:ribonuclease HII